MPQGRWIRSEEQLAQEAFAVLIQKKKPTRTFTKDALAQELSSATVALDFLKLCLEFDNKGDLQQFKRGLLFVIRAGHGTSKLSRATGVSRITLYRMLSPGGNPRLSTLTALFRELGLRLWVVDEDFIRRREKVTRPKDRKKYLGK
jgi:probable addiction module antidote protein